MNQYLKRSDVVTRFHTTEDGVRQLAIFSTCGKYRYALGRMWTPATHHDRTKVLVVIGLNPSTADERQDDPTIRRCISFAKAWGHHGLTMLNLFAFRATDPKDMKAAIANGLDAYGGPAQEEALRVFTEKRRVLCAWGANVDDRTLAGHAKPVVAMVRLLGRELVHLGLTDAGHPKHPLYLKGDLQPTRWT